MDGDIRRDNQQKRGHTRVTVGFLSKQRTFFKEKEIKLMSNFNTACEIYQRAKRTKEHVVSDQ